MIYLVAIALPTLGSPENWYGWFPATMSSFLVGTVFGSLAICTTSAWLAGSVRRSGLSEWVAASARGTHGVYRQPIIFCASLGMVAYTLTFLTMAIMTLTRSTEQPAESPGLSVVLLLAWASAVAWAAIGATLGRFLRSEIAIPAALLISYASFVIPAFYLSGTPIIGLMLSDGRHWVALAPHGWQLAANLLFWFGLAVLFTAIATTRRRVAAVGAALTLVGVTAGMFLGSTLAPLDGAEERVCHGDELQVCTDQAHSVMLPEFHALAADALEVLPDSVRPDVVDETAEHEPGVLAFAPIDGNTTPAFTLDRQATITTLGEALFSRCAHAQTTALEPLGEQNSLVAASLEAWWRIEQGISIEDPITLGGAAWLRNPELSEAPERGQELADLSSAARQAWFEDNSSAITECTFDAVDWP